MVVLCDKALSSAVGAVFYLNWIEISGYKTAQRCLLFWPISPMEPIQQPTRNIKFEEELTSNMRIYLLGL